MVKNQYRIELEKYRRSLGQNTFISKYLNQIKRAVDNPESFINHMEYRRQINQFYWSWPYEMTGKKVNAILKECNSERDFDGQMQIHFTPNRTRRLLEQVYLYLPRRHKIIFRQVITAYWNHNYVIANIALMVIIDNLLQKYMVNPGSVKRNGIFDPIVKYYGEYTPREVTFWIRLDMLSHAVNIIFEQYNFKDKIDVITNKQARRHLSVHGIRYSNKRVDTLLLINTIYEISYNEKYLKPFVATIQYASKMERMEIDKKKMKLIQKRIQNLEIINKE